MTQTAKQRIQHGFDHAASGYDLPMLDFFHRTAAQMLQHLAPHPCQQWLDVCTGTGAVSLSAAQQRPQCQVTGVDLSQGMLQQASAKAQQRQLTNIQLQQMDMEALAFTPAQFDIVSCSYGVFFVEDMVGALSSLYQQLKPGGHLAISVFMEHAFSPMADVFIADYERTGHSVPPPAWKQLATESRLSAVFQQAGIHSLKIHPTPLRRAITDSAQWWELVWNAGWRSLLSALDDHSLAQFKHQHLANIDQLIQDAGPPGLELNTDSLIAIAHKAAA